jgi:hypothetical protein
MAVWTVIKETTKTLFLAIDEWERNPSEILRRNAARFLKERERERERRDKFEGGLNSQN